MIRRRIALALLAGSHAAVFGCSGSNPSLYLSPQVGRSGPAATSSRTVAVREVVLPDHARDARLSERRDDGSLVHLDDHRWADAPARSVTRTLASALRGLTGAHGGRRAVAGSGVAGRDRRRPIRCLRRHPGPARRAQGPHDRGRARCVAVAEVPVLRHSKPVAAEGFQDVMVALSQSLRTLAEQLVAEGL